MPAPNKNKTANNTGDQKNAKTEDPPRRRRPVKVRILMKTGMGCIPLRRDEDGRILTDRKGNSTPAGIPFSRNVDQEYEVFPDEARGLIRRGFAEYISGDIDEDELLAGV